MTEVTNSVNAQIAEKILGLVICDKRYVKWTISGVLNSWDCPIHGPEGCVPATDIPSYDHDINWAWQVVEKLGLWVFPYEGRWYAGYLKDRLSYINVVTGVMDFGFNGLESGTTAPEAICRMALLTLNLPVT